MVRFLVPALILLATSASADEVIGKVVAYDRVDAIIVMEDKTVFDVPNPDVIPADLVAGETIKVIYVTDGDNGLVKISSITRG